MIKRQPLLVGMDVQAVSEVFDTLSAKLIREHTQIAAAASLVIGEAAEGTPVAIVRGATYDPDETAGIGELLRPLEKDLFR